jgi:hypothetical protein
LEKELVKICTKCKVEKPYDMFHRVSSINDKLRPSCKECRREEAISYRDRFGEIIRIRDNSRLVKQRHASVVGTNKYRARYKALNAINLGKMKRLSCEVCGSEKSHAHHDDYNKPLDVRFLCSRHHRIWHIDNGEAKNP